MTKDYLSTLSVNLINSYLFNKGFVPEIELVKKSLSENEIAVLCVCISEQLDFRYDNLITKYFMVNTDAYLSGYEIKKTLGNYFLFHFSEPTPNFHLYFNILNHETN